MITRYEILTETGRELRLVTETASTFNRDDHWFETMQTEQDVRRTAASHRVKINIIRED